jgi:formylglycine-generating enzyme required for sulfatase activity
MHGTRLLASFLTLATLAALAAALSARYQTHILLDALPHTKIEKIPEVVSQLAAYPRWVYSSRLHDLAKAKGPDAHSRLGYQLALLPEDPAQLDDLYDRLLAADPTELPVLCDALKAHGPALAPRLRAVLETAQPGDPKVLTSAGALAYFRPNNPAWTASAAKVASALLGVNDLFLGAWVRDLRPVHDQLKAPLAAIFTDDRRPDGERSVATVILADFASDDAPTLANLVTEADPKNFAILLPKALAYSSLVVPLWSSELEKALKHAGPAGQSERDKDREAARGARAAIALLRSGEAESVWPHLRHGVDSRLRSFIVSWLRPYGADPNVVLGELLRLSAKSQPAPAPGLDSPDAILFNPEISTRRALILALGTYDPESIAAGERETLILRLLDLFAADPDPGIHGAADWTLRRWGQDQPLSEKDRALRGVNRGEKGWFVNPEGQTFVVVGNYLNFPMGSPPSEPGRRPQELLHTQLIHRSFAVATKEVTVQQYQRFLDDRRKKREIDPNSPDPNGPINSITWYEAAEYCNWLGRQEGLHEVYEPNDSGEFAEGMKIKPESLERPGYRLPTEPEWEYMCRAGALTSRYYGNSPKILSSYAWFVANSADRSWPCGSLFPNDFGMFDMLGNVYEWCQGRALDYKPDKSGTLVDDFHQSEIILNSNSRLIRGGSFIDRPEDSRSAQRDRESPENRYMTYGFRLARTIP